MAVNESQQHWNQIYSTKLLEETSWFQDDPATSLRLITSVSDAADSVIDIGAGGSFLVDELLENGYQDVTVLDISDHVLDQVQQRITGKKKSVSVIASDVTSWVPSRKFNVWHDRAVFHFLVEPVAVETYKEVLRQALSSDGVAIIGTFAEDGPESCSCLPIQRYSAEDLVRVFSGDFVLEKSERETHLTPWRAEQSFTWVVLRRRA
jgi:2-polyprenyl-3-methyl-5-hydroxy-6-metoxy-1,4-benzoquinol methylase